LSQRWFVLAVFLVVRVAMGYQFQSAALAAPSLVREFGIDYATVGTLVGVYVLPGIAISLPSGFIGRRFGEQRMIVIGLLFMTGGGLVSGFAHGITMVFVGRLIAGFGVVFLFVMMTKTVGDWFPGRGLFLAMSIFLFGWPIGIGIGLVTQDATVSAWGWHSVFHISAIACAVAAVLMTVAYRPPPTAVASSEPEPVVGLTRWTLSRSEIAGVSLAGLLWSLLNAAYAIITAFSSDYLASVGVETAEANLLVSFVTWFGVFGLVVGGWVAGITRYRSAYLVLTAGAGGLALTLVPFTGIYTALFVTIGLFTFAASGIIVSLPLELTRPVNRAPGMGIFYAWWYAGLAGFPPLGGLARDLTGDPAAPLLFGGGLIFVGLALLAPIRWLQRRYPLAT
jgi:MFS family permease